MIKFLSSFARPEKKECGTCNIWRNLFVTKQFSVTVLEKSFYPHTSFSLSLSALCTLANTVSDTWALLFNNFFFRTVSIAHVWLQLVVSLGAWSDLNSYPATRKLHTMIHTAHQFPWCPLLIPTNKAMHIFLNCLWFTCDDLWTAVVSLQTCLLCDICQLPTSLLNLPWRTAKSQNRPRTFWHLDSQNQSERFKENHLHNEWGSLWFVQPGNPVPVEAKNSIFLQNPASLFIKHISVQPVSALSTSNEVHSPWRSWDLFSWENMHNTPCVSILAAIGIDPPQSAKKRFRTRIGFTTGNKGAYQRQKWVLRL